MVLKMSPQTRLAWTIVMIVVSALYGLLVAADAVTGIAVALGYVAVLLTLFVVNEFWRHR